MFDGAKPRDLQFADLSWTCFSTERSGAEGSLCGCVFLEMFFDGAYRDFLPHRSHRRPPHVVLRKENHTQLTEAATLDRKSGKPRDLQFSSSASAVNESETADPSASLRRT